MPKTDPTKNQTPEDALIRGGMPLYTRPDMYIRANTFDETDNSQEVSFGSGADVTRFDWNTGEYYVERLLMTPKAVRLGRWNEGKGAPILLDHDTRKVESTVGRSVPGTARIENGVFISRVKWSKAARHTDTVGDIRADIITDVSIGYRVFNWDIKKNGADNGLDLRTATDWEPYEGSAVGVKADLDAGTRTDPSVRPPETVEVAAKGADNKEDTRMDPEKNGTPAAQPAAPVVDEAKIRSEAIAEGQKLEATRQFEIRDAARKLDIEESQIADYLKDATKTPTEAMRAMIDIKAAADKATPTHAGHIAVTGDETGKRFAAMSDGLAFASNQRGEAPKDEARYYVNARFVDIARECLTIAGVDSRGMSDSEVFNKAFQTHSRMLSTSDFTKILSDASNKNFFSGFASESLDFLTLSVARSVPNLKSVQELSLSAMTKPKVTPEGAEIKYGKVTENGESWDMTTITSGAQITRKALLDNDINLLGEIQYRLGASFATTVLDSWWAMFLSTDVMSDGHQLFDAVNHLNYTASGAAPDVTEINKGRKLMRTQKDIDGVTNLNLVPDRIIIPATHESAVDQLFGIMMPAQASNVVPTVIRSLQPIVQPRLDTADADAWYLFCSRWPSFAHGFLQGQSTPMVETRESWEVLGVEMKAFLDFGCGRRLWQGVYKNAGT